MSARADGTTPRVLVTNAEQRSVLASCRCLAAAGYRVSAVSFARRAAAHRSRSCDQSLRMTDPALDGERFLRELAEHLRHERYDVLVPGSDTALLAISGAREQLPELARAGLPDHDVVERSLNREALSDAAGRAGLATAAAIRCESPEQALLAARELGYPVLVKSIQTAQWTGYAVRQGMPSCLATAEQELLEAVGEERPLLIQGAEPGEPYSFGGVMIDDRLVALSMSRYRRTWPPAAGYAAFAETVDPPCALEQMVQALMRDIGWQGMFELELIRGVGDRFVPIDLNPRPYGSIALAVSAGAPLPAIWCDWLLTRELPGAAYGNAVADDTATDGSPLRARADYRYRWEDADLRNVVWRLRRGRLADALRVARPRRHVTHAYFRLNDPLPLTVRLLDIASNRVGHADEQSAGP